MFSSPYSRPPQYGVSQGYSSTARPPSMQPSTSSKPQAAPSPPPVAVPAGANSPFPQFSEMFLRIHNSSQIEWRQTKLLAEAVGVDRSKITSSKRDAMMKDMVALLYNAIVCDKKLIDVSRNTSAWQRIFEFKHFEGKALQSVHADPREYFYEERGRIVISRGWLRSKKIIKTKYENRFQLSKLWRDACLCGRAAPQNSAVVQCQVAGCGKRYHRKCVGWVGQPPAIFECPKCALQGQDPLHDVAEVLVEPSMLVRKTEYNFTLTDDQRIRFKENKQLGVEIRCMKLRYQHYYEHTWPELMRVSLNNSVIVDVRPTDDEKRKDTKPFLRKNLLVGRNLLKVEFKDPDELERGYRVGKFIIGIFIVNKMATKELSERIIADNRVTPAQTSVFLQKLTQEYGKDMGVEEFTCDLQCKLTMKSMSIPARGLYCTHLQCFSLDSFLSLQANRPVREWYCQICHKPAHRMIFDEFFLAMVSKARDERMKTGKNYSKFAVNAKLESRLISTDEAEKPENNHNIEERCIADSKNQQEMANSQGTQAKKATLMSDHGRFGTGQDIEYSSDEEGDLAGFGEGPQPTGTNEEGEELEAQGGGNSQLEGATALLKQAILESQSSTKPGANGWETRDESGSKMGRQKTFVIDPNPVITPRGRPRKQGIPKNLGKRFESDGEDEECGITQQSRGMASSSSGQGRQQPPGYPHLLKDFPRYEDMRRRAAAHGVGLEKKQIPWLLPAHTVVPRPGGSLRPLEEKLKSAIITEELDAEGRSVQELTEEYLGLLRTASLLGGGPWADAPSLLL